MSKRPPGTPNRPTIEMSELVARGAFDPDPLEHLESLEAEEQRLRDAGAFVTPEMLDRIGTADTESAGFGVWAAGQGPRFRKGDRVRVQLAEVVREVVIDATGQGRDGTPFYAVMRDTGGHAYPSIEWLDEHGELVLRDRYAASGDRGDVAAARRR